MSPDQLEKQFIAFREEAIELRNLVNTHDALFGDAAGVQQVLRDAAANFFNDLHSWLTELYFLKVGRLTDPEKSNGQSNLTVKYLIGELRAAGRLTATIESLANKLEDYRKQNIAEVRHKRIAHNDLGNAVVPTISGAHTKQAFEGFLEDLQNFCDEVGRALTVGPLDFRTQPGPGDVHDLIWVLEQAQIPTGKPMQ